MADMATLAARLAQAEEALHKVALGQAVELVTEDGSTVKFARANKRDLDAYISTLRGEIADLATPHRPRGPIRFVF